MALFTFMLEYGGGTFLGQSEGARPKDALLRWMRELPVEISLVTDITSTEFEEGFKASKAEAIDDVKNVWCFSGKIKGQLALVHVIRTEA